MDATQQPGRNTVTRYDNEWASEILGRPIAEDAPLSYQDFAALEVAIAERKAEEARLEREKAERDAAIAADPNLPLRQRAAELRKAAEERAALVADARTLIADSLSLNYPQSFIEGLSDDEAIAAAFGESGDPYSVTNESGHTFVVDPKDKPSVAPQTLAERQKAWTEAEEARERRQWEGQN
jgi:hypothetical protein